MSKICWWSRTKLNILAESETKVHAKIASVCSSCIGNRSLIFGVITYMLKTGSDASEHLVLLSRDDYLLNCLSAAPNIIHLPTVCILVHLNIKLCGRKLSIERIVKHSTPSYLLSPFIILIGAVVYTSSSTFGPGNGPVFLSNLQCIGSEENLLECRNTLFVGRYCTHERDVGLRCEGKVIDIHA